MNKNKTTAQNKKIAVLPGDGIGPEIVREAIKVSLPRRGSRVRSPSRALKKTSLRCLFLISKLLRFQVASIPSFSIPFFCFQTNFSMLLLLFLLPHTKIFPGSVTDFYFFQYCKYSIPYHGPGNIQHNIIHIKSSKSTEQLK